MLVATLVNLAKKNDLVASKNCCVSNSETSSKISTCQDNNLTENFNTFHNRKCLSKPILQINNWNLNFTNFIFIIITNIIYAK